MKNLTTRSSVTTLGLGLLFLVVTAFLPKENSTELPYNFVKGAVEFESIGELSFSPEGILFFGDTKGASIFALETSDSKSTTNEGINLGDVEEKIGQMMGAASKDISVMDMAVHPSSQNVYLSIMRASGENASYHIVSISKDEKITEVDMRNASHSTFSLSKTPARDATDRRGRSLRTNTITDIAFADGSVYVAGLSNEEFASGFRKVSFPFKKNESLSTLEIFHVAHNQYETHSPIRSFAPYMMNGESTILAGYTCTPLVLFPTSNLKDGDHVKGKTVAELGFGNTPLDILPFTSESGKQVVLIANSNRATMLVTGEDIAKQEALTTGLEGDSILKGTPYKPLPLSGVQQLAELNSEQVALLRRMSDGSLRLYSYPKSRLAS